MRSAFAAFLVLSLPAAAWAGHVESTVLREGTPGTYWRKNKDTVLARLKNWKGATLEDLVGTQNGRSMYAYALVAALSEKKSPDYAAIYKRSQLIYTSDLFKKEIKAKEWLEKANEFLANDSKRLERLKKFLEDAEVVDSIKSQLTRYDGTSPERVITDLVMVMEFLRPENKNFFLNGYSHDAISPGGSYAGLYPGVKWDSKSVASMRKEAFEILADIGPSAVPTMERALRELKANAKSDGKVTLPVGSLPVATGWSTKATRFSVPVHEEFKAEMATLIKLAGGSAPPSDARATLDQANEAFRKHQASLRKTNGVKDVLVDQDEDTAFLLVVTAKGSKVKLDLEIDGVPVRILQE